MAFGCQSRQIINNCWRNFSLLAFVYGVLRCEGKLSFRCKFLTTKDLIVSFVECGMIVMRVEGEKT